MQSISTNDSNRLESKKINRICKNLPLRYSVHSYMRDNTPAASFSHQVSYFSNQTLHRWQYKTHRRRPRNRDISPTLYVAWKYSGVLVFGDYETNWTGPPLYQRGLEGYPLIQKDLIWKGLLIPPLVSVRCCRF